MSDKSFGDHMSRGIVKNPLLSTAVTGLSIEDLTHHAVLLPVSRSQELIGRQEQGTQNITPAPEITPSPSGDATFTPIHPPQNDKKDDFDVNEYFARLQGTRYVSAPINSHIEDTKANLEAKEENLEEINLNDPIEDVQQSITADIAQNFSQLPTVLPQVASAVFSSFSSMLNMKSREHTPEERCKTQGVQVQAQGVPLMGVSEREVAPPPKEPPVTGPGNYRLTTKKKYAQIPGLTSGESAQMPAYTPPTFNQPIYTPPQLNVKDSFTNVESHIPTLDVGQSNVDTNVFNSIPQSIPVDTTNNRPNIFDAPKEDNSNFVATSQYAQDFSPQAAIIPPPPMFSNLAKKENTSNVGKAILPPSVARRIGSNKPTITNQTPAFSTFDNIFVPTPVTADTESSVPPDLRSFVPAEQTNPLAASFPLSYTSQGPSQSDLSSTPLPLRNKVSSPNVPPNVSLDKPPTAQFASESTSQIGSPIAMSGNIPSSAEVSIFNTQITASVPPPPTNIFTPPSATISSVKMPCITSHAETGSILTPPQMFTSGTQSQPVASPTTFIPKSHTQSAQIMPPPANMPPFANVASVSTMSTSATSAPPKIFNPYLQDQPNPGSEGSAQTTTPRPPTVPQTFNLLNKHESILKTGITDTIPLGDPPKIPEPPKATGQTNFRMNKKRPQYYSGPIEGVGAISNNVKPTLDPVASTAFHGALYTPDANTGCQPAVFTPENVSTSSQGTTITPTVTENPNQSSMFTSLGINVDTPNTQYAFDKPADNVGFTLFDVNKAPENVGGTYNTAFDMSHQTGNTYESPKEETAFGIIGSLKSKLSSIDINKLQNSVTTFFDPAYNATKSEANKEYEPTYAQNHGIEIFVANPETPAQPYNYDAHQASFTYGQGAIPNATDYYNQQVHNVYSTNSYYSEPSYGTQSYSRTELQNQQICTQPTDVYFDPDPENDCSSQSSKASPFTYQPYSQHTNVYDPRPDDDSSSVPKYQGNITSFLQQATDIQESVLADRQESAESSDGVSVDTTKVDYISVFPGQVDSDIAQTNQPPNEENLKEAMKNLQIEKDVNAKLEETEEKDSLNKYLMQYDPKNPLNNIKSDFDDLIPEKAFLDVVNKKNVINYFDMQENAEKEPDYFKQEEKMQLDTMFSAPLHDLSSMIADKSREICDGVSDLGDDVSWNTNEEEIDNQSIGERLLALSDSSDDSEHLSDRQGVDLNICETCREVNQPEQKDADFTTQLIENITAPIQLLNPVEAPLTETRTIVPAVPDAFDTINQCAEISLIADETVETLQVHSATELLEENKNSNNETSYGWRTEAPLPLGQDLLDHDYAFKTNLDSIGFFGNDDILFDNTGKKDNDKVKIHDESPVVLQRQMSFPTAPPAEDFDDTKSDETGALDVQSIEQDASKDFPVFEEFVIEPSETDDDKIEFKDKPDENKDTFTNRVDRFKKLEGTDETSDQKDLGSSNILMPSYFDTGNYAAETHFKNSLSTPTISRIPPGFDDHYELKPKTLNKKIGVVKVPDTSTQTNLTTTISEAHTRTENLTATVFSNIQEQEPQLEATLPDFASVFGANIFLEDKRICSDEKTIKLPSKDQAPTNPQVIIEDKVQATKLVSLPDPINFFASSTQKPDESERKADDTDGVNRLASYFASPAKTDNTKSFFELSQGQDHYRLNKDDKIEEQKPFFDLSQSQDHYKENISNIPPDRFLANLSLMNDLTSCQNIDPSNEQIVRTVNYFTVEYDNSNLNFNKDTITNFNKGESSIELKQSDFIETKKEIEETTINNDEVSTDIVNKCAYCSDFNNSSVFAVREVNFDSIGKVQFRQVMDTNSNPSEEKIMQPRREEERSVGVRLDDIADDGASSEGVAMMTENRSSNEYEPVKHHWFYRVDSEDKSTWRGFSISDSRAIENAFQSPDLHEGTLVPTDGGRYDVNVIRRLRISVYWTDKPTNVRRCSWFYKGTTDARYVPYTEAVAEKLEVEYRHGVTTGEWHRRLVLPNNELVVMHGPAVMVHFLQAGADAFGAPNLFSFGKRVYRNPPKFKVCHDLPPKIDHLLLLVHGAGEWRHQRDKIQSTMRPRVVRRGIDDSEIEDTEPSSIDHLLLLCHGVGSACDMRFRAVEEVVDDFRATSWQLLQSHYRNSYDNGIVSRVEVLPISWHAPLHTGPDGVDRRLARVTLASIPRLRNFTNDTVLDVLLYTSPHYCQMILDTVCGELNRIYTLFMKRNPEFKGQVSLGGHSLGSVILYDLLCNQPIPLNPSTPRSEKTYLSGSAANNPSFQYPKLCFQPLALYALGSPIAIFECIRGVESLGSEFYLPTCKNFFNIFHPYDPIAYRIEPLVNPQLQDVKPSLIPHHKGRKRMHLELKDTMARVGADLKQKLVESIKSTWSSMWGAAAPPDHQLEKVVEEEIEKEQLEAEIAREEPIQTDITPGEMLGRLNGGRRVDHVLQEAPFEMINEYLFAMSSHVCYWESEDVMLLMLREIYDSMGVQPDVTVPQQSLSVQRVTIVRDGEKVVVNSTDASTSRVS